MTIKAQTETDQTVSAMADAGMAGMRHMWNREPPKIEELRRAARILHAASLDGAAYALESLAVAFEKLEEDRRPL